tara:strand:- start:71 stop:340 length:270 start_codon:yes stop_codon:yes gene_type:complete
MSLLNEKLKLMSCTEFRVFLKKLIEDKIEKEWTPNFIDNMNFLMIPRMTIKRRYENKGIDLIKLINSNSYYQKVKKNVNSRGSLEFKDK